MDGTVVASYECLTSPFLGIDDCRSFNKASECNVSHISTTPESGLFIPEDTISNGTTDSFYPKIDQSFDEEVEITDMEEIKTPRIASPTLNELRKRLANVSLNAKVTLNSHISECSKINNQFNQKLLSEVASKSCLYSLDRLYDEYIPGRSRICPLKGKLGLPSDVKFGDQKSRINLRSISSKNTLRLLERIPVCSLPSPLLRQTYSSSGSLISNLTDLSFSSDAILSIPLAAGLHVSEAASSAILSSKGGSALNQMAKSSMRSSESPQSTDKTSCEPVSNGLSGEKEVSKSFYNPNHGLSESQNSDSNILIPNSQVCPGEQCFSPHTQSYISGCLREKHHTRSKRSENRKSLASKKDDLSCIEVKTPMNDTNMVNENVKPQCSDLVEFDPFNEPISKIECRSSSNTLEKVSDKRALLSDCDDDKVATSLTTNINTHPDSCDILLPSSSFPTSYINEEPLIVEEDFTPVTNKRLRRKQQQNSKLVQNKTCNSEQSSCDLGHKTHSYLSTQLVNNVSTFQQHHVTHRFSSNLSRRSVQRSGMYSNVHEKSQSSSARSATVLPHPQDASSRKSRNADNVSSSVSSTLHNPKQTSNSYSHSVNRDLTSQKSVYSNPYLNSSLRYSKVIKKPFSNSAPITPSSNVQGTQPAVSPVQYQMLKQFMISAWKSFAKS
ncbi:unnamed protein product [Schistosoma rodhaini]|uniref:Uncharacterized protein n=1 Tax=Schistosoma rodhaini TaxID=6188 RepID=A0AA85EYT8_9TREM|nr:unnamed protein product [Schistosoma rodhaini]